jgi:hypothetical protein
MLLVDDLLLLPVRGIALVAQKIHQAAEQESADEAQAIRDELGQMYMKVETGELSEAEFDALEKPLLDRLEKLESRGADADDDGQTDDR